MMPGASAGSPQAQSLRCCREKAGLRPEGTLRRAALEDDGLHDLAIFSLLDD